MLNSKCKPKKGLHFDCMVSPKNFYPKFEFMMKKECGTLASQPYVDCIKISCGPHLACKVQVPHPWLKSFLISFFKNSALKFVFMRSNC